MIRDESEIVNCPLNANEEKDMSLYSMWNIYYDKAITNISGGIPKVTPDSRHAIIWVKNKQKAAKV